MSIIMAKCTMILLLWYNDILCVASDNVAMQYRNILLLLLLIILKTILYYSIIILSMYWYTVLNAIL